MLIFLAIMAWLFAWACTVGIISLLFWAAWQVWPDVLSIPLFVNESIDFLNDLLDWNIPNPTDIYFPSSPDLTELLQFTGTGSFILLSMIYAIYAITPLGWHMRGLGPVIKLKSNTLIRSELHEVARLAKMRTPAAWGLLTSTPNAMAISAPFGRRAVAVTEGLLHVCTRDELRWVIAHELGHLHYGDGAGNGLWIAAAQWGTFARHIRAKVLGLLLRIVAILPILRLIVPLLAWFFYVLILLLDVVEHIARLTLRLLSRAASRHAEFRADRFAARLLGPEPGISMLEKLGGQKGGIALPDLFSTHPSARRRIKRLRQMATR